MFFRILAAIIVSFWVLMTALLVKHAIRPGRSKLVEVPPSYIVRLMSRQAQPSDLNIFENQKRIGSLSLRPGMSKSGNLRVIEFSGNLLVGLPLASRARVSCSGLVEFDRHLDVQRLEFDSRQQGSEYASRVRFDAAGRAVNFALLLNDRVASERAINVDDLGRSGGLSEFGIDDKFLANIRGRYTAPTVVARSAEIPFGGETIQAFVVTVRQGNTTLAEISLNQLGQVIQAATPFGYSLSTLDTPP